MNLLRALLLSSLILISCCNNQPKEERIIIFLDVSRSNDDSEFNHNLKMIEQLFNEFKGPGIFKVYPILNNASLPQIDRVKLSAMGPFSGSKDTEKQNAKKKDEWLELKQNIEESYKSYQESDNKMQSCIIQTLETAYEQVKDNKDNYKSYVFYITDILEDCDRPQAPTGGISLEGNNLMKKDTVLARLDKYYHPDFNLASVLGNRLYFITASDYGKKVKTWPLHDLKYFWRYGVLSKLGYTEAEARDIYINPDLPDKLFMD